MTSDAPDDDSPPDRLRCSIASSPSRRRAVLDKIRLAAVKVLEEEDPWAKYNLQSIPAERIVRYSYDPSSCRWSSYETIAKVEKEPFTNGAMRHCYRMKKLAAPPRDSSNTRFHSQGWSRAPNYVAKCYNNKDGTINTSDEAREAVFNDIRLQYEAAMWADKFNDRDPPRKINVIRAYAIEFPDRPGSPVFAVERFISGRCEDGAGFVKHNTNSGFVDTDLRRATPQVFSAHSFYASRGRRLVADVQGVGDLFTDPQVHSYDLRFGDGDLGPRGMALFFSSFHHCALADAMGIPVFPLSRNEFKHQMRNLLGAGADSFEDDEDYDDEDADKFDGDGLGAGRLGKDEDDSIDPDGAAEAAAIDLLARLDLNRQKRSILLRSPQRRRPSRADTERQSNVSGLHAGLSALAADDECGPGAGSVLGAGGAVRPPLASSSPPSSPMRKPNWHRSQSDSDEVSMCLSLALTDYVYDHSSFHRLPSGLLDDSHHGDEPKNGCQTRRKTVMRKVLNPMIPDEETRRNLGSVHYHLACLHGSGRFPEVVPTPPLSSEGEQISTPPSHDAYSVLFHLCHGSSLRDARSCLALARVKSGLGTTVSDLLPTVTPVDFDGAKDLLRRAMESPSADHGGGEEEESPPSAAAATARAMAAAGCLLVQVLEDEGLAGDSARAALAANDPSMADLLENVIALKEEAERRDATERAARDCRERIEPVVADGYHPGDRVEADFACEGTYYPATVTEVSDDGTSVVVKYDDDGSTERLMVDKVRSVDGGCAKTAANVDCLVLDSIENTDEKCLFETYQLQAKLAELKASVGDLVTASALFEEAATGAMEHGKMQTATQYSLKAAELQP